MPSEPLVDVGGGSKLDIVKVDVDAHGVLERYTGGHDSAVVMNIPQLVTLIIASNNQAEDQQLVSRASVQPSAHSDPITHGETHSRKSGMNGELNRIVECVPRREAILTELQKWRAATTESYAARKQDLSAVALKDGRL